MFKNFLFVITTILIFAACGDEPKSATQVAEEKATDQIFGEKINADDALTFTDLLNKMDQLDSMETKVTGTVESVCKKKGCWVNIVSDDGREMFVKFKDYGFFLPKDCEGRKVVMEGKAFREVTPVDELQHLAEDGGASKEEIAKITEAKEELKFMASGVMLLAEQEVKKEAESKQ
ncbi:MAG: DUF4920 domain-containing protein [Saprospiraceae bacterium]